ncbi:MAG: sugar ABC transporter ATP-binding protein [Phycisphaerales bacterium]
MPSPNHPIKLHPVTQSNDPTPVLIAVEHLSKRFANVRALDDVCLNFRAGEIHGIIGENGAGKSTLMNLLAGIGAPGAGTIYWRGQAVTFADPAEAIRRGIAMVHQELNLVSELSVAENIFLGRSPGGFFIDRHTQNVRAAEYLSQIGADILPGELVKNLGLAQRQLVEIARALSTDARVLILDEPTAVLARSDVENLFAVIRHLRGEGRCVICISHLLDEVKALCDRITVLRDGRVVTMLDTDQVRQTGEQQLASLMVGRAMSDHFPRRGRFITPAPAPGSNAPAPGSVPAPGRVALEVSHLSVPGRVRDVSFSVRRGEILGFAGLIGAGRTELGEALVGLRRKTGEIKIDGESPPLRNVADAMRHGLVYLSEDRRGCGLVMGMSISHNMTLAALRRGLRRFADRHAERIAVDEQVERLSIKIGDAGDMIGTLSGGNQQKVAIAKWLLTEPRVMILDEPTRGVDIGAKEEIYRLIRKLADEGMACVMISSELNELLGLCDRIAVMRQGRIAAILDATTATEQSIMAHAAGVASTSAS